MRREDVGLAATVLTNVAPVVGVAVLDWSLATVVLVYWVELGVVLAYALLRGLFAQHPPQRAQYPGVVGALARKRGGISLPWRDLQVQVSNLPIVAIASLLFAFGWLASGLLALAGVQLAAGARVDDGAAMATLAALVGVTVGRGLETASDYFLAGRYREMNVQLALRSGFVPLFVVGSVLAAGGALAAAGAPGAILLAGLVATKTTLDLAAHYGGPPPSVDEGRLPTTWLEEPPQWLEVEAIEPRRRVRSHRGALLLDGVLRGLRSGIGLLGLCSVAAGVAITVTTGTTAPLRLFGGVGALAVAGGCLVATVDRALRFGWMEYRVGRHLVGYDRLLGEPQWQLPGWKVQHADARRTFVDRRFGTETLVVEHEDWDVRAPHVPHVGALEPTDGPASPESDRSSEHDARTSPSEPNRETGDGTNEPDLADGGSNDADRLET